MALNSDKEVRAWAHHAEVDENDKPIEHQYRLDKNGLPLVPQPSDHKHDPLVSLALPIPSRNVQGHPN